MTEDTYTHKPGQVDDERGGRQSDDDDEIVHPNAPVERGNEEWNLRDWVLVGVIFTCFIVIPAAIYVIPPVRPFRFAYLVLPLIPAILLGLVAVWSAQRSSGA
ncbi:hypothetical protein [Halorussus lipolyticus]|uniref:hypothetical protein n=1 Tax=Halorussus lipolyticus TaxID=3034024 RepID=UPI0023E7A25D|nr:hypothetical protein [Halorussus sp. DT80]